MNETQTTQNAKFISLRIKIMVGFFVLFSIVFTLTSYWFYRYATQVAMNRVSEDLKVILEGTAAQVNGDEFQTLATEGKPREDGYTDDPRYWDHVKWLDKVYRLDNRVRLYSFIKGPQTNEVIFIGSNGALWDPPAGAPFLYSYIPEYKPEIIINGLDTTTLFLEIYPDEWGSWISGYTPIFNSIGERVGGLGVDIEASYVLRVQREVRVWVIAIFIIANVILFVFVFFISRSLTRPIVRLAHLTQLIGEGDYNQDLSGLMKGRLRDEISALAHDFAIMVSKVYQREQTLRKQVEELRIEIDETKRHTQVREIVDTDFFRDLQSRANSMRDRRMRKTGMFSRDVLKDYLPGGAQSGTPGDKPTE